MSRGTHGGASVDVDTRARIGDIVQAAYDVSEELGVEVDQILQDAELDGLGEEGLAELLSRVITVLRRGAEKAGDAAALESLEGDVRELSRSLASGAVGHETSDDPDLDSHQVDLEEFGGLGVGPVLPTPVFHTREVPMMEGHVRARDIELWGGNARLEIHLEQFRSREDREPTGEELIDIMMGRAALPGVDNDDEFEIRDLARSIAVNGVQKPPIIDRDGTLLDGNRRLTACRYLLLSDEFTTDERRRAERIHVWQLTEHATADDRDAVNVASNFEPDYKMQWPEYVKARKVYDEWQATLALEARHPGPQRQAQLKKELSARFALGPSTGPVNRYLKMVDWAKDFEGYHVVGKGRNEFEVKHAANKYFQYFDELAKGSRPGGVAWVLGQDETLKELVFDLLLAGRFRNWNQIRDLKHVYEVEDARETLAKARDEPDDEIAKDHVDDALAIAKTRRAETRSLGANARIESFVKWLEDLPVRAFRDSVSKENLQRLLRALQLVGSYAEEALVEEQDLFGDA